MRKDNIARITKLVLAFVLITNARSSAQESAEKEFSIQKHKQFYAILHNILAPGGNSSALLTLYSPGEFIGIPDETTEQGLNTIDFYGNRIPETTWISTGQNLHSVREIYETILNGKELPIITLTEAQEKQKADAIKVLYKTYSDGGDASEISEVRRRYNREVILLNSLRSAWATAAPEYKAQAFSAWQTAKQNIAIDNPDFARVEKHVSVIDSLEYLAGSAYWNERKAEFESHKQSGLNFPRTWLMPAPAEWAKDDAWTRYTISSNQFESTYALKQFNLGASGSFSLGLFSIGGGGANEELSIKERSDVKNLSISIELLPVSIYRPWLRGAILSSTTWKWPSNSKYPSL